MGNRETAFRTNVRAATLAWGRLNKDARRSLAALTDKYSLSVTLGDLQYIDGRWYVTHAGLLRLAERRRCRGIRTAVDRRLSDSNLNRWVFRATVYTPTSRKGFVGYGDADPTNVSPLVRGSEMRIAETRATSRALRKAYGIGLCSVEELGYVAASPSPSSSVGKGTVRPASNGNGTGNGQPRLRDRLSLLIRQHQLDPTAVKLFAAEFCGTHELREASREMVESFIQHLAEWASKDRDGLLCKLNSYSIPAEVRS